jgi:hypothetical protein
MSPNKSNARARERAVAARAAQRRAERRRTIVRWTAVVGVVIVLAAGAIGLALSRSGSNGSPASLGPEGIAIEPGTVLAAASSAATGQTVDGIKCESTEQVAYHIHAHLAVFVNGHSRPIPLGIGVVSPQVSDGFAQASKCYYWLHTHVQDGVIHIESPT